MLYLLPHAIERAAARDPDREAVRCSGDALSYAELVAWADRLARVLVDEGVRRGERVGVFLDKGLRAAVAIYGIMKAGAAYVPLDPAAPPARLAFMVRDGGLRHLVTDEAKRPALARLGADGVRLTACVGVEGGGDLPGRGVPWEAVAAAPAEAPAVGTTEQDLAYVLYTSGSTGVPKGVMHTHRSALGWAEIAAHTYGLRPDDRLSNHAPLHFDLSTLDYFGAAVAGATTVVVPEAYTKLPAALSKLMEDERLTVLYVVPLALTHLLLYGALDKRDLRALRWVLFGGEPLAPRHLRALMRAWPHARFSNVYGPTEVNGVTYYLVPPDYAEGEGDAPIPIGRPYGNVEILVVDADGQPVEPGTAGELLVRTPTMMRGYWGRPDLNAGAFYRRPVFGHYEDVFHRTGDLVRQRTDGTLLFLGRKDRQIKARGYRVDLAEVEAVLATHDAVVAAAAFGVPDDQGSQRIEAAVTVRDGAALTPDALRRHAAAYLPAYAVPAAVAVVDAFPETSTGKIDRLALQARAAARPSAVPSRP